MIRAGLAAFVIALATSCKAPPPDQELEIPEGWTPIQLAFTKDAQVFDKGWAVHGLRLSAWSTQNRRVHGIDLNLGKSFSGGGAGIALSLVWTALWDDFYGIQISGGMNTSQGPSGSEAEDLNGVQLAILANDSTVVNGTQVALLNVCLRMHGIQAGVGNGAKEVYGVQAGLWNIATTVYGLQAAVLNTSTTTHGIQLGIVNGSGPGLQIGIVNYNEDSDSGVQIGLLNFKEHGFLPWFPFVNF